MCRPTKRPKALAPAPMVQELKPELVENQAFEMMSKADMETFDSFADLFTDSNDDMMFMSSPMMEEESTANSMTVSGDADRPKTFVFTAFDMVNNPENAAAVGFNAEGTALEIRDLVLLSEKILPKYFRHKNVTSFYRQLNSYGFRTIRSSSTEIAHTFSHELFKRDRADLLNRIFRKKCCPKDKKLEKVSKPETSASSSESSTPSTSPASSPDASFQVSPRGEVPALELERSSSSSSSESEQALEEARLHQRKAAERARALEARNRELAAENKSILMESERIFQSMNVLVEAQTIAIEKLFGRDASKAFAEQAKPFRFDFEQPAAAKAASQVKAQAHDYNEFVAETNDFLFQDEDLQMLENIFTVDGSELLA